MTATALIIRKTPRGRRTFAIDINDAQRLVQEGKAYAHSKTLFEELPPDALYQTKVVEAQLPGTEPAVKRKRGRPHKLKETSV